MRAKKVYEAIKHLPGRSQEELRDIVLKMPSDLKKLELAKKYNIELPQKEIESIILKMPDTNLRKKIILANKFGVELPEEEVKRYILALPISREKLNMAQKYGIELPEEETTKAKNLLEPKERVLQKISRYNLNADVVVDKGNLLLVHIGDAVASANLGSQEWSISEAKGYGRYRKKISKEEFIDELLKPTESTVSFFNNTYQLSKYKKCYFLFDFEFDFPMNKLCFIVGPDRRIKSGWDAAERYIPDMVDYILDNYPELNQE